MARRSDRHLLIVLLEQSKQVCQVRVSYFGNEQLDSTVKSAFEFMVDLAKYYIEDKVSRANLMMERDLRLPSKFAAKARRTLKKPAAQSYKEKTQLDEQGSGHEGDTEFKGSEHNCYIEAKENEHEGDRTAPPTTPQPRRTKAPVQAAVPPFLVDEPPKDVECELEESLLQIG